MARIGQIFPPQVGCKQQRSGRLVNQAGYSNCHPQERTTYRAPHLNRLIQNGQRAIEDRMLANSWINMFFVTPNDLGGKVRANYKNKIHPNFAANDKPRSWI